MSQIHQLDCSYGRLKMTLPASHQLAINVLLKNITFLWLLQFFDVTAVNKCINCYFVHLFKKLAWIQSDAITKPQSFFSKSNNKKNTSSTVKYRLCLLRPSGETGFELWGERQLPEAERLRDSSSQCESLLAPATVSRSASEAMLLAAIAGDSPRHTPDPRGSDDWHTLTSRYYQTTAGNNWAKISIINSPKKWLLINHNH